MKILLRRSKIVMFIVMTALFGISSACIKVQPKFKYPTIDCHWADDVENNSAFVGIVKIDSIIPMHSDEESDYQHYTYKVYYSNAQEIFNTIEKNGVFVYQSLSICGERTDIEMKVGSEYLVSLSKVNKIPYSDIYIGIAKTFLESKTMIMIMNRFAIKNQSDNIKQTILNYKTKCIQIENQSSKVKSNNLEDLE